MIVCMGNSYTFKMRMGMGIWFVWGHFNNRVAGGNKTELCGMKSRCKIALAI